MDHDRQQDYGKYIQAIDSLLERHRGKWQLKAIAWMDYDDVKQIIRVHIYKKWHKRNPSLPVEPWANTIIQNQIKNLLRNNYKNYARPCLNCPHNAGGEECLLTQSGMQDQSCALFNKWAQKKRAGFNLKLPVSLESHAHELEPNEKSYTDIEGLTERINSRMKERLSDRYYQAYLMMCVQAKTDEEVAEFMGYKSSEKNRKAGYKQIKNLKEMFKRHVMDILHTEDIIY
jgi:DNA-directed RNA polymerase specialized sigma24 family protein